MTGTQNNKYLGKQPLSLVKKKRCSEQQAFGRRYTEFRAGHTIPHSQIARLVRGSLLIPNFSRPVVLAVSLLGGSAALAQNIPPFFPLAGLDGSNVSGHSSA